MTHTWIVALLSMPFLFGGGWEGHTPPGTNVPGGEKDGTEHHAGWLGVSVVDMTPRLHRSMKAVADEGALVTTVMKESPARTAGFREDDIILEVSGKHVTDAGDLRRIIRATEPGTNVSVTIEREGKQQSLSVNIGISPRRERAYAFTVPPVPHIPRVPRGGLFVFGNNVLGLSLHTLNSQLAGFLGVPDRRGVLVEEVDEGSTGEHAGFKAGDVITQADGERVADTRDVIEVIHSSRNQDSVAFTVFRKGSLLTLSTPSRSRDDNTWFFNESFDFEYAPDVSDHDGDMRGLQFRLDDGMMRLERRLERLAPRIGRMGERLKTLANEV